MALHMAMNMAMQVAMMTGDNDDNANGTKHADGECLIGGKKEILQNEEGGNQNPPKLKEQHAIAIGMGKTYGTHKTATRRVQLGQVKVDGILGHSASP